MELTSQLQATEARTESPRLWLILLASIGLLLSSCGDGKPAERLKGRYNGGSGEVLVVMDKTQWEGAPGETIRQEFGRTRSLLPQAEPVLDVTQINKEAFSNFLRYHRNIIIADIADNERNVETRTTFEESKWAKGQLVYTIHALDEERFLAELTQVAPTIVDNINEEERKRLQAYGRVVEGKDFRLQLEESMGLGLSIPKDFNAVTLGPHYSAFLRERVMYLSGVGHDVQQGIIVYDYPYQGDSLFTPAFQVALRDSITAAHVRSSFDAPMRVEDLIPAQGREVNVVNNFGYEMRGLWRFDRPIMGGAFVSLSMVDKKNERVITVDGYVFAPKFDKREFLRELEAIAYSLNF